MNDSRATAAQYYDLNPDAPDDLEFYRALLPSPAARVLRGCPVRC